MSNISPFLFIKTACISNLRNSTSSLPNISTSHTSTLLFWDLYWDSLISIKWPMVFSVSNSQTLFSLHFTWTHCCPWNYSLDLPDTEFTWFSPSCSHLFCFLWSLLPNCCLNIGVFWRQCSLANASPLPILLYLKLLKLIKCFLLLYLKKPSGSSTIHTYLQHVGDMF